jgi:multidrug efflux pump subunit AcrA (membrane-fusion protein)
MACSPAEPPAAQNTEPAQTAGAASVTESPVPAAQTKQQTAAVRRGNIAETVAANGRVGGVDEVPLSLTVASRVLNVEVEQGEAVAEGQTLLETDRSAIEREIGLSRERLSEASARYEKAQAAVQAEVQRLKETQQRALIAQQQIADDNQSKLRHAIDELALLRAGPPANEVLTAEGAVIAARATLQRAQGDLARAQAGPDPTELKLAQQEVTVATVALRKAESDLQKLESGPDPFVVSRYESELLAAQNGLAVAKGQYDLVARGADPTEIRAVERQIQSLRFDREATRRGDADDKNARLARNATVNKLDLAIQTAEEQLAKLKAGPDPNAVQAARRNVELAERAVRDAIERLRIARQGADQITIDAATATVEAAKLGVEKAQRKVDALQAGPTSEQLDALESVLAGAQTAVQAAEARLSEVRNPRGRSMQIRDAEDRIAALQAQAETIAQVDASTPIDEEAVDEHPEIVVAQKAVAQEQISLQALEKGLSESRLVAPFPGVVSAVLARAGEPVRPGRPSIILSRGDETVVRIDIPEREASRVIAGQQAAVVLENVPTKFDAIVTNVVEQGGARVGLLTVTWPGEEPSLGTPVQAAIQVRRKEDVLLVPQTAIRTLGSRRYVEVVEGGTTRRVDVEVGMAADGDVEIVNGVREGQQVVAGS